MTKSNHIECYYGVGISLIGIVMSIHHILGYEHDKTVELGIAKPIEKVISRKIFRQLRHHINHDLSVQHVERILKFLRRGTAYNSILYAIAVP